MKTGISLCFYVFPEESVCFYALHLEMFHKTGALGNFAKFTGKYQYQGYILIKLKTGEMQLYHKKRVQHRCFQLNFYKKAWLDYN